MHKKILVIAVLLVVGSVAGVTILSRGAPVEEASASGLRGLIGISPQVADQRVDALEAEAPPEQQEAFVDGDITLDEYEEAVQGTVSCFEQGFAELRERFGYGADEVRMTPVDPAPSEDEFEVTYSYTVDGPALSEATPEQEEALTDLEVRCQEDEHSAVEQAYQVEQLADPEYVEGVAETFAGCVDDEAGLVVDSSDEQEVIETMTEGMQGADHEPIVECLEATPSVSSGLANATIGAS